MTTQPFRWQVQSMARITRLFSEVSLQPREVRQLEIRNKLLQLKSCICEKSASCTQSGEQPRPVGPTDFGFGILVATFERRSLFGYLGTVREIWGIMFRRGWNWWEPSRADVDRPYRRAALSVRLRTIICHGPKVFGIIQATPGRSIHEVPYFRQALPTGVHSLHETLVICTYLSNVRICHEKFRFLESSVVT